MWQIINYDDTEPKIKLQLFSLVMNPFVEIYSINVFYYCRMSDNQSKKSFPFNINGARVECNNVGKSNRIFTTENRN